MKNQFVIIGALALCLLTAQLFSQEKKSKEKREDLEEIVLSATTFELKKENTGKVIYKKTFKQMLVNQ